MATKKAPAKTPAKAAGSATVKNLTKTEIIRRIAESAELAPKQVNSVFTLLTDLAVKEAKKNGQFVVPGFGKTSQTQPIRHAAHANIAQKHTLTTCSENP